MKITLTDAIHEQIRVYSQCQYIIEISHTNNFYATHSELTWEDITSYVLSHVNINMKTEYSMDETTYASSIDFVIYGVEYWLEWIARSSKYIELRIRCVQTTGSNVSVGSFTIFGGRIYKDDFKEDDGKDILTVRAYSYMVSCNDIPSYQIDTRYHDTSESHVTSKYFTFSFSQINDSRYHNFEGKFLLEQTSANFYSWNKGTSVDLVTVNPQTMYDFRGASYGKMTVLGGYDGGDEYITIKKVNNGDPVTDNLPFREVPPSSVKRILKRILTEAGISVGSQFYQDLNILTKFSTYQNAGRTTEISAIYTTGEDPTLNYLLMDETFFASYASRYIYYWASNYTKMLRYDTQECEVSLVNTTTVPFNTGTFTKLQCYESVSEARIYMVWQETDDVKCSYLDLSNNTYGATVTLDSSVGSNSDSFQFIYSESLKGWAGLNSNVINSSFFYYDIPTSTGYSSATLTFVYGGLTFDQIPDFPAVWVDFNGTNDVTFYGVAYATSGGTHYLNLFGSTINQATKTWSGTITSLGTDTENFNNSGTKQVYNTHATWKTNGAISITNSSDDSIFHFDISAMPTTGTTITTSSPANVIIANDNSDKLYWATDDNILHHSFNTEEINVEVPYLYSLGPYSVSNRKNQTFGSSYYALLMAQGVPDATIQYSYGTFYKIGEAFEPFVPSINTTSGSLRDLLNEFQKSYGMSIFINDDKTAEIKYKYDIYGTIISSGDSININESDVMKIELLDSFKPYKFVKGVSGSVIRGTNGEGVFRSFPDGVPNYSIRSNTIPTNILDSVVQNRWCAVSSFYKFYKIVLNYKADFIEIYDIAIMSVPNYTTQVNQSGVIVEKNSFTNSNTTELVVMFYSDNNIIQQDNSLIIDHNDNLIGYH